MPVAELRRIGLGDRDGHASVTRNRPDACVDIRRIVERPIFAPFHEAPVLSIGDLGSGSTGKRLPLGSRAGGERDRLPIPRKRGVTPEVRSLNDREVQVRQAPQEEGGSSVQNGPDH